MRWCCATGSPNPFLLVIVVTPLFLGEVVRTYSWIIVLGNNGFINSVLLNLGIIAQPVQFMFTTFGVVVALVHVTMPVMVVMLAAALSHIDRNYQRAAESLGAGPIRVFLTVTLPLSMPGIVAGVTTAFAWTFSAFATPQLIGGGRVNMISNLVYQLGFASFNFPFAASLCVAGLALRSSSCRCCGWRRARWKISGRIDMPRSTLQRLLGLSGSSSSCYPRLPGAAGGCRHDRGI